MERLTGRQREDRHLQEETKEFTVSKRRETMQKCISTAAVYHFCRGVEGIYWCLCATTPQPTPSLWASSKPATSKPWTLEAHLVYMLPHLMYFFIFTLLHTSKRKMKILFWWSMLENDPESMIAHKMIVYEIIVNREEILRYSVFLSPQTPTLKCGWCTKTSEWRRRRQW